MSAPAPDPHNRVEQALLRLEASRTQLRTVLLPPPEDPSHAAAGGHARWLLRAGARLRHWLAGTPFAPLVRPAIGALQGWWQHHPWRRASVAAGQAMGDNIGPTIRRHPVASVAIAAGAGAALVALRPWRWQPLAQQAEAAGRHVFDSTLRWSWQQFSQPAVQAALAGALTAWMARADDKAPSPEHEGSAPSASPASAQSDMP